MMKRAHGVLAAVFLALAACASTPSDQQTVPAGFVPIDADDQVAAMGRGVNIIGYDPIWTGRGEPRFEMRHFEIIKDGGFQTVRVNLHAFEHMDSQNRLDADWLATLDRVVAGALAQGLTVILDEHDFNACAEDVVACRPKLLAFWSQIAERYRDAPNTVVFELLNEPNRALDPLWNDLHPELLAVVRQSNPTRNVIIGPIFWNNVNYLDQLVLPEDDRHLIVTVHYYLPFAFTHQGAPWTPENPETGIAWGSPADRAALAADFDKVEAWSQRYDRPILLGEFGVYDKAELQYRVAWTDAVSRAAEARGWAWTYWQFDSDFVVYDVDGDRWNTPIYQALIPEAR